MYFRSKFLTFFFLAGLFLGMSVFAKGDGINFLSLAKEAWSGENIAQLSKEIGTNALIVQGENPALLASVEPLYANNFPKFRVTLIASRDLKGVVLWGKDGRVTGETFEIRGSENFQDYSVDLWSVPTYAGMVDLFGIGWADYEGFQQGGPQEVKIISMVLEGDRSQSAFWGNIKRFFYAERLRPHSINALSGWVFNGKSFTLLWGLLFFLAVLILMGIRIIFRVPRASLIAEIALLFLIFWGAYDMRRILDLTAIVKISWNDFVRQSPYDKTYYDLGDFHGFLNFVKDYSKEADTICFEAVRTWPFNQGATYFLAPHKVLYGTRATKENCTVWASYKVPHLQRPGEIEIGGEQIKLTDIMQFKDHGFAGRMQ